MFLSVVVEDVVLTASRLRATASERTEMGFCCFFYRGYS
jgi:hypothetical protein